MGPRYRFTLHTNITTHRTRHAVCPTLLWQLIIMPAAATAAYAPDNQKGGKLKEKVKDKKDNDDDVRLFPRSLPS